MGRGGVEEWRKEGLGVGRSGRKKRALILPSSCEGQPTWRIGVSISANVSPGMTSL